VGTRHGTETNDPKKREQKKPIKAPPLFIEVFVESERTSIE
jgi:hypothetical protein